jgi:hypothetical protein
VFNLVLLLILVIVTPALPVSARSVMRRAGGAKTTSIRSENSQLRSCRKFVQNFYNWYIEPSVQERKHLESTAKHEDRDIDQMRSYLSPELYRVLKIDYDAQAKVPGEIVGLDFDPVLNAQDVADRYVTGKITPGKKSWRVEVYGFWNGEKSKKPDVVPELVPFKGKWRFVNFHYLRDKQRDDLIGVLKYLREDRQRQAQAKQGAR